MHFEKDELGKIYKMKESVQGNVIVKETSKSSGKKSSNNTIKDNVSTFDIDDCAMDIELVPTDAIVNNRSEELGKQKSNEVTSGQNIRLEDNLQVDKKLNEEETEDIKLVYDEENSSDTTKTKIKNTPPRSSDVASVICHKTPRRVKLITLSSPKEPKKQ